MPREPDVQDSPIAALYRALLLFAALAVVFAPLLSLPPFHKGVYFQSEPVAIGLSLALAGAALALALQTQLSGNASVRLPAPAVVAAGIALLSLVLSAFHVLGARSLTGSLEFADGAVSFLWLATAIAAGHSLFHQRLTRWLLAGGMFALVVLLLISRAFMAHRPDWQILGFSDYLTLYMVPLAFVYLALSRSWRIRARWAGLIVTVGLVLGLAWLSNSRAGYVVLLAIVVAWIFLTLVQRWWFPRWPAVGIAVIIIGAMVVSFAAVWIIGQQVGPEGIRKQPIVVQSIWSRYQLANIVVTALSSQWSAWLTGFGWGSFRDYLVLYGPGQEGVQFFVNYFRVLATNWDSLNRLAGHSHSMYLESLLAIGIWGPVLWAVFLCSVAQAIRGSAGRTVLALLVGHILLTSIWFMLPMVMGFFGLAIGMLLAAFGEEDKSDHAVARRTASPPGFSVVLVYAVSSAVLLTSTAYAWRKAGYGERLMASVSTPDFRSPNGGCGDVRGIPHEGEYSGRALLSVASLLGTAPPASFATPMQQTHTEELQQWLARLACISAADLQRAPSHFLRYARLQSRYLLSVGDRTEADDPRTQAFWDSWPTELEDFARLGSAREELVLAYVNRLYEYGPSGEILTFCDPASTQVGQGAACQLFRGMVLADNESTREDGQRAIRLAIDAGIEKFMALPPSFYEKYLTNPTGADSTGRDRQSLRKGC